MKLLSHGSFRWLIRQDIRRGWGRKWTSWLDVVLSVAALQARGILAGLGVLVILTLISWFIGWYAQKKNLLQYEAEYMMRLNPMMLKIEEKVNENENN